MYTVECDNEVFYDDTSLLTDTKLITPRLELSDNTAGTFEMTIPADNRAYDRIKRITSTITVRKNGKYLWSGRPMNENEDFFGRRKFSCEGALSFLNDVVIPTKKYTALTIFSLLSAVLTDYNNRITSASRKIYIGAVTVNRDDLVKDYKIDYQTPLEFIQNECLDEFGGHLFISERDSKLYLNYYQDYPNTATQSIDFGVNLLDFAKDYDLSKICTVCIPRGKQIASTSSSGSSDEYTTRYTTVESVNGGSPYVSNPVGVRDYGVIEKMVDFNDVDDPVQLLKLAQIYMSNLQFDSMTLTVRAVDLHMLSPDIESFNWLDNVRCVSLPHGMDKFFPINSVSLPLDTPENVEYTLGRTENPTASGNYATSERVNQKKLSDVPTRESVLVAATSKAEEILAKKTTGYVNIVDQGDHSEALIISNILDWPNASQYWKFDMNGLGYYQDGHLNGIAITMDGNIVADYITTGTMSADRIRTGIIKDIYNDNLINLETGEILLKADKTVVRDASGHSYNVASMNDIDGVNSQINSVSRKQTEIATDIDSITTRVSSLEANYGYCYTGSATAAKVVNCVNFKLHTGSIIVVKFTYATNVNNPTLNVNNTGAKPICINGSALTSNNKYNWGNGQTVSFVYDGTYWNISDGATESKIQQLANSITLSVTNGQIGKTASIQISADSSSTSTGKKSLELDMTKVREAFKNDSTSITVSAGRITFNSGTFVLNSGNCTIDANGNLSCSNGKFNGRVESLTSNTTHYCHTVINNGIISFRKNTVTGQECARIYGRTDNSGILDIWANSTLWLHVDDIAVNGQGGGVTGSYNGLRFAKGICVEFE